MIVEVESNDNCETGCVARFKEAGPARPVFHVRLYDRNPAGKMGRACLRRSFATRAGPHAGTDGAASGGARTGRRPSWRAHAGRSSMPVVRRRWTGTSVFVPLISRRSETEPDPAHESSPFSGSRPATAPISPLPAQTQQAIRPRHSRDSTEQASVYGTTRVLGFQQTRHPGALGEAESSQSLFSPAADAPISASPQRQTLNALVVLDQDVLEQKRGLIEGVVRARRPRRVPSAPWAPVGAHDASPAPQGTPGRK
jgi:hypothetical protein